MSAFIRRAKAVIARFLASAADPSTATTMAQLYAKSVSGTLQLFGMDSDGNVYQGTPYFGLAKNNMYYGDDFVMSSFSSIQVNASGTVVFTTAVQGAPGIATLSAISAASASRATIITNSGIVASWMVGVNVCVFDSRCRTPTVQDATDQWTNRWGISDAATGADVTDGLYFESDRALNGDNNVRLCSAATGSRTKTSMGVAPTANTFERWKLIMNAAGTSVQGYLNDTATGAAVTATLPGAGNNTAPYGVQMLKTLGNANTRSVDVDYVEGYQIFSPTMR